LATSNAISRRVYHEQPHVLERLRQYVRARQADRLAPHLSATASARDDEVVTSRDCASGLCSACASRSAATNSARALSSAITITSVTPAGRSAAAPAGSCATSSLAAVTKALPGPKILSHFGNARGAVGHGGNGLRAADFEYLVDSGFARGHQHRGVRRALRFGGVHMTRTGQAASAAGTPSMMAVDGSGATRRAHTGRRRDRHAEALAHHPGRGLHAQRGGRLRRVKAAHGFNRPLYRR
jgi:hypothetical protein